MNVRSVCLHTTLSLCEKGTFFFVIMHIYSAVYIYNSTVFVIGMYFRIFPCLLIINAHAHAHAYCIYDSTCECGSKQNQISQLKYSNAQTQRKKGIRAEKTIQPNTTNQTAPAIQYIRDK